MKIGLGVGVAAVVLVLAGAAAIRAADVGDLVQTIKQVGPEAKGSEQAAAAVAELTKTSASALPEILAGLDEAGPLASNYLRGVIETIAQRELGRGGKLPAGEIEKFVRDTKHSPRARRLAYELLVRVDATAPERLVPGFLNDPSVELRRDAVARLIDEANRKFDAGDKDASKPLYRQALAGARDDDQVQTLKKRLEELGEKVDLPSHFGFLMAWKLIAPFDNTDKKGFNVVYPPERELNFAAEYEGKEGMKAAWVEHTTTQEYGIVDLAKALAPHKGAICYATTEFTSEKAQPVDFRLGTPNSWKVWLNGELLFAREEYHRGMSLDQYRMRGTLKPGKNVILVKICQNEQKEEWAQRWQFQLRVCDGTGTAVLSLNRADAKTPAASGGDE
jgi:hypothetical protein